MLGLDRRAAQITWTAVVVLLSLYLIYRIRETLFLLIIAILLAYLLYPVVSWIQRLLPARSRTPALALVYLVLVGAVALALAGIGSKVVEQAGSLVQKAPEFLSNLQKPSPVPLPGSVEGLRQQAVNQLRAYVTTHYSNAVQYLPHLGLQVLSVTSNLIFLVIVPILSFLLLKDASEMRAGLMELLSARQQGFASGLLQDIHDVLVQYVRAIFYLSLATFLSFSIVLSILGVPYALLLAAFAFPLEFIPLIGPLIAAAVVIAVSVLAGYPHILWVIIFLGLYRMFTDYVLSPRLMSKGVEVHPLLVILGVFAGEQIGGVPGIFLSVPTLALLRVFYRRLQAHR